MGQLLVIWLAGRERLWRARQNHCYGIIILLDGSDRWFAATSVHEDVFLVCLRVNRLYRWWRIGGNRQEQILRHGLLPKT